MKEDKLKVVVFGSYNVDITAYISDFPQSGESIFSSKNVIESGGKGANQALAAARAGADVHFITKVGDDYFGKMAEQAIRDSEITTSSVMISATEPTGKAIIYISEKTKDNTIVICPGANTAVTQEEVTAFIPIIQKSDILLVQGENNNDATELLIRAAWENKKTVVLNPAPYSLSTLKVLPYVTIITPNETEASSLSGMTICDVESAKSAAARIAACGPATVIITLGSKGVLVYHNKEYRHIPVFKCTAIDTTGAGDAFNGAFVASLADGLSIIEAATWASAFASLAVERLGASNHPDKSEVDRRLSETL